MIYNGAAVREQLSTLRDALMVAKDRTELDPFDEAMFNAIRYMLELSDIHSIAVESVLKTTKKLERKVR
jgi:hypothetical protein